MIITTEVRAELLASGWAEPVTDPVRLDTLAYVARNERSELIAALPNGTAWTINLSDRREHIEWWNLSVRATEKFPALSSDLTDWARRQCGPVRCWTT